MLQLSGYLHHSVLAYKIIHSWIFHWPLQPKIDMSKWCCTPYIRFHLILLICTSYDLGYDITWYCLIRLNDFNLTRQTAQRLVCKFNFFQQETLQRLKSGGFTVWGPRVFIVQKFAHISLWWYYKSKGPLVPNPNPRDPTFVFSSTFLPRARKIRK